MIISNVELAALVGKLTGNKNTAMAYGAALAVFNGMTKSYARLMTLPR